MTFIYNIACNGKKSRVFLLYIMLTIDLQNKVTKKYEKIQNNPRAYAHILIMRTHTREMKV